MKDEISVMIEEAAIGLLVKDGSFTCGAVFDLVMNKDRNVHRALSHLNNRYPQYRFHQAYEAYIYSRIRSWVSRKDRQGENIFVSEAVNGDFRKGVRYSMRMDASASLLEKSALIKATLASYTARSALRDYETSNLLIENQSASLNDAGDMGPEIVEAARKSTQSVGTPEILRLTTGGQP